MENKEPGIMIFPNKTKTSDKQPDYKIQLLADGVFVEIGAAWKKVSKNTNQTFLSVKLDKEWELKKKDDTPEEAPESKQRSKYESTGQMEQINIDDIPF